MNFLRTYKKLLPCLLTLLLTGALLVFSVTTFSWFSSNLRAPVSGETVRIDVPDCVFISSKFAPDIDQTMFPYAELGENSFDFSAGFTPQSVLYPASSPDGLEFRYSTNVNPDGTAGDPPVGTAKFALVEEGDEEYFFLERTFYFCSANVGDITVYLKDVAFGTSPSFPSAQLYHAVRAAVSTDGGATFTIVKCETDGDALPANGDATWCSADPAVSADALTQSTVNLTIPGIQIVDGEKYSPFATLIVRIWIEGQNENAVAAYAGTAFTVSMGFETVD